MIAYLAAKFLKMTEKQLEELRDELKEEPEAYAVLQRVLDQRFPKGSSLEIHETDPKGSPGSEEKMSIIDEDPGEYDPKFDDSDGSDGLRESREYHPDKQ